MDFLKMKQMMELKSHVDKIQKEMAKIVVDVEKGPVKVTMNGQQKLLSISINPEAITADKAKQLEDNILKTVNDAIDKAKKESSKQMAGMMGGMGLPGLG